MARAPKQEKETQATDQPTQVTLSSPYGYMDDDEQLHFWQTGMVVTDPAEISDLITRLAPLVEFPESC